MPIATAESWDGGSGGGCNGFLYRFRQVSIASAPGGSWVPLVGGYAIISAKSKAEAIELTKRFLKTMGRGESEIRLMQDAPAFDASSAPPSGKAAQKPRGKAAARA